MTSESTSHTDLELVTRARAGDQHAMVELWTRHFPAVLSEARRAARQPRDADEMAADAFSGMLAAIGTGGGPTGSVRAYLYTSVRNLAVTRARRASAADVLTGDTSMFERLGDGPRDPVAHRAELGLMREAFAALPERWQVVLWRTAVDRESNVVVGEELGMSPNAVAALARRARRGLRSAYLQAHVSSHGVAPGCEPFVPRLADLAVGDGAGGAPTRAHVESCSRCAARLGELRAVDQRIASVLAPAVLGLHALAAPAAGGAALAGGTAVARGATAATARHTASTLSRGLLAAGVGGAAVVAVLVLQSAHSPAASPPTVTPSVTASLPATTAATSPPTTTRPTASATSAPRTTKPAQLPHPTHSTPTPQTVVTPVAVQLGLSESSGQTAITVTATGRGTSGPVTLRVAVPRGVTLAGASGDWSGCTQSGTQITCTAAHESGGTWSGSLLTSWPSGAAGIVDVEVRARYGTGASLSAGVSSRWPSR